MKKILNQTTELIPQVIEGFLASYGTDYKKTEANGIIVSDLKDKVSVLTGGGSGHEPLFLGFVGDGLADGVAIGNVFAAPTPDTVLDVTQALDKGQGVLYVYGNYSGDILNFDMAAELADLAGIETRTVLVRDDVASAPSEKKEERRGIAGDVFVIKIAGAASREGLSLDETARVAQKASDSTFSIGVALSPGTIPGLDKPTFTIPDDEIEFGMGIHGEPGVERTKLMEADALVDKMLEILLRESDIQAGDEVCLLLNGLGSTTLLELFVMNRRVQEVLKDKGIVIHDADVNNYCTTQEMGGASISMMKLDEELKNYFDQPAYSPYYAKRGKHN
ncbi:dihydroxyacetone kinase subunit DhaK [Shouchella clausii]|uniref:dihydroxyacetone kinase subunit DhaK n=1 Tax=Shouchella tritolerans TaxID=2979466 RepID=UPI000786CD17|nr:dihydroxyacetone kinase subunit DhaK [Shouchella tritolerans]GIN11631.1 dihydroxyacetone kinase subunit DhaK [Shouchella clausii]